MNYVGIGYDVHQLVENRPLILGTVNIPYARGLDGHSDADVLTHAISDALLGAIGLGDIGTFFPNTDESIKGISSSEILKQVYKEITKQKGIIANIDSTIIAEEPKVTPHINKMKENYAKILNLPKERIGIKATTNEKMGFLGRKEGISAMATCSIYSKSTLK